VDGAGRRKKSGRSAVALAIGHAPARARKATARRRLKKARKGKKRQEKARKARKGKKSRNGQNNQPRGKH
jgi:hypothetical protein